MTEEIQTKNTNNPGDTMNNPPSLPPALKRTFIISYFILALTLIDAATHYNTFGAWQILADAAGVVVALILLIISNVQFLRGKKENATTLITLSVFAAFLPGELFLQGVTFYNILNGLIIFGLMFFILRPESPIQWARFAGIYVLLGVGLSTIPIVNQFDINSSASWRISLPITTILIATLFFWQVISNWQIRTIRTRLLLIIMGIGLIPTLLISVVSTAVGYQRDLTQTENTLNTALALKTEQINIWQQQINNNFTILQQNEDFVQNTEQYIAVAFTDSFYLQIYRQDILSILNSYIGTDANFSEISIIDMNGSVVLSTQLENEGRDFSENLLFINGSTETTNAPLTYNEDLGQIEFYVAYPLQNAAGQTVAVLIGKANSIMLTNTLMQSITTDQAENSYLISENNDLLTPLVENMMISVGTNIDPNFLTAITSDENNTPQTYTNIAGTNAIGIKRYIPEISAYLIVEQPVSEAFQTRSLNLVINSSLTILTFIAIIVISIRAARNISTPLVKLSEEAALVSKKELDLIEPIDRMDEIGELSESLSTMTGELFQTTTNLENIVAERTKMLERRTTYLETTSEISKALTGIYNLEDLLNTVSFLISENFGFYHVGIFLLDDRKEYAELKASNSEGGWRMLAREHKLKVGEQGIVGFVTGSGQPRVQQQVEGEESVHYNNPDLPLTKSEMALPLKAGNEIFGALDVQSTEESAFSDEDVSALQVLADAVAVAIQNTRLVQQLQESLETERKIYGDLTSSSWRALLSSAATLPAFKSDQFGVQAVSTSSTTIAQKAAASGEIQITPAKQDTDTHQLALPVSVRGGTVVAVIETEKPASAGQWTHEEITILESVSTELGMAIENARLFEETQRIAQRERISANLSSKIWASADVENILQTAVRELGSALNISYGTIKLKLPDEPESNGNLDGVEQE